MIQIRRSVFETNSSSAHAIIVKKTGQYATEAMIMEPFYNEDHKLHPWESEMEFGRMFNVLTTWEEKLYFVFASYSGDEPKINETLAIVTKRVQSFNGIEWPLDHYDNKPYHGYVDHQSMGLLQYFLEDRSINLDEFIFSDRYIVIIDGDEYGYLGKLCQTIIDMDNIEVIYHPGDWVVDA